MLRSHFENDREFSPNSNGFAADNGVKVGGNFFNSLGTIFIAILYNLSTKNMTKKIHNIIVFLPLLAQLILEGVDVQPLGTYLYLSFPRDVKWNNSLKE